MATAEETAQKVQRILIGEFNDVRLTKDGGFAVPLGSSVAFVEPVDWAPDAEGNARSLVRIWAPSAARSPRPRSCSSGRRPRASRSGSAASRSSRTRTGPAS